MAAFPLNDARFDFEIFIWFLVEAHIKVCIYVAMHASVRAMGLSEAQDYSKFKNIEFQVCIVLIYESIFDWIFKLVKTRVGGK